MGRNLTNLNINETFEELVQISGSVFTDGLGNIIDTIDITSSFADNALSASFSQTAESASFAENANSSTTATSASFADFALLADNANTATSSSQADNATTADFATSASQADNANVALNALTADFATSASQADNANTATNADFATSASFATTASFAINAENAVPYTGADQDVDLGDFGLSTNHITFDNTPVNVPTDSGTISWSEDDEALQVQLNGYKQIIGGDVFYPVKNQSGVNIPKGTSVQFAGTLGASGRLLIAPFLADGSVKSSFFMGVTAEDIDNGEDGKVLWFGRLRQINTSAFSEGDVLYASTTVAGGFQTTVPEFPNNTVQIAAVINSSVNQGVLFIRPSIGRIFDNIVAGSNVNIDNTDPNNPVISVDSVPSASFADFATSASQADNANTATSASFADFALSSSFTEFAVSASQAENSNTSTTALNAINADNATSASFADFALSSSQADNANTATTALNADNATSASFADFATSASQATNADTAVSASFATNADNATTADFATSSSQADNANTAVSASFATTASFALNVDDPFPFTGSAEISGSLEVEGPILRKENGLSGSVIDNITDEFADPRVNHVVTLTQAEYDNLPIVDNNTFYLITDAPSFATSASFADFATSSSQADNANTSISASFADNAGSADTATSASFADFATSSSFADTAVSASFATTASFALNATGTTVSGSENFIAKFTSPDGVTESLIFDNGTDVGIGTTTPNARLDVNADILVNGVRVGKGGGNINTNTAVGANALLSNTSGFDNTAFGSESLRNTNSGIRNTAFGEQALRNNTSGTQNTAVGRSALSNVTTGGSNTAVGTNALTSNTASNNTAVGRSALFSNTTGGSNTAVGLGALESNTTGGSNTAVGLSALLSNTGGNNTAVGTNALLFNTTGGSNTVLGVDSGRRIANGNNLTKADNSLFIGRDTRALDNDQTNQIVIGYEAIGLGSNTVIIGNNDITLTRLQGSVEAPGGFVGDLTGTASFADLAVSASFADFATSASFADSVVSASFADFATSASFAISVNNDSLPNEIEIKARLIGNVEDIGSSASIEVDFSTANFFQVELIENGDVELDILNIKAGQTIIMEVETKDGSTLTLPASVKFSGGTAYVPTQANSIDVLTFVSFDDTRLYLSDIKNFS